MISTFTAALLIFGCASESAPDAAASLYDADSAGRLTALFRLSPDAKEAAVDRLLSLAASDPADDVRHAALSLLGTVRSEAGLPLLQRTAMDWGDGYAQMASIRALGMHASGCEALVSLWVRWPPPTTDPKIQEIRHQLIAAGDRCLPAARAQADAHAERIAPLIGAISND